MAGEGGEEGVGAGEGLEGGDGGGGLGGDAGAGGGEAVEGEVGGLAGAGVFAGGFAEGGGVGGGIQDVVHDLEGEAEVAAGAAESRHGGGIGVGHEAAEGEGGLDHGGGFAEVDEFEGGGVRRGGGVFGEEVGHLAADEAATAGGIGQLADQGVGEKGMGGVGFGEEGEGVGQEGVADEEGGGFVVGAVDGGAAATEVVVIHAGEVVMDERVGVEALECGGGRVRGGGFAVGFEI